MKPINTAESFSLYFKKLKNDRNKKKKKQPRRYRLFMSDKISILEKAGYKCHVCGGPVTLSNFHANHVAPHSSSANSRIDNFLPSCNVCNRARWFFDPEEIQWILKLGIFVKTEIEKKSVLGKEIAEKYIKAKFK